MQLNQTPRTKPLIRLSNATIPEVTKAQSVRLLDVAVFGPLMLFSAMNKTPPKWVQLGMLAVGAGTILYNLSNFVDTVKRNQDTNP